MTAASERDSLTIGAWLPADWRRPLTADEKARAEQSPIDILLVPENHDTWANRGPWTQAAEAMDTAIYAGFEDDGWNLGLFYDPVSETETVYTKHSTSDRIAFERDDWTPEAYLPTIDLPGGRVGLTICHDHYFSPLMCYEGLDDALALLNLSATPVSRHKWGEVLQARAIENAAYTVCTTHGRDQEGSEGGPNKAHVFAFDPFGEPVAMTELESGRTRTPFETAPDNIYHFPVDPVRAADARATLDEPAERPAIERVRTNTYGTPAVTDATLDVQVTGEQLRLRHGGDDATVAIGESARLEFGDETVSVVALAGEALLQPERLYGLLDVPDIDDHRLLIQNHWDELSPAFLENTVAPVARARCVEWCSPVLVTVPDQTRAYQLANKHKHTHELPPVDGGWYPFELGRAFGVSSTLKPVHDQREALHELAVACATAR